MQSSEYTSVGRGDATMKWSQEKLSEVSLPDGAAEALETRNGRSDAESRHKDGANSCIRSEGRQSASCVAVQRGGTVTELTPSVLDDLRRLARVTHHVLLGRTKVEAQQQQLDVHQTLLRKSTNDLKAALDAATTPAMLEDQRIRVRELHLRYIADYDAVLHQESAMKVARVDLDVREYELLQRERVLDELFSIIADLRPDLGQHLRTDVSKTSRGTSVSSASSVPSLLGRYWSRKGDVAICGERLDELDAEYHEKAEQIELFLDRGDPVPPPYMEFMAEYPARSGKIRRDLETAEMDTAALKAECDTAKLDTEPVRRTSLPESEPDSPYHSHQSKGLTQIADVQAVNPAFVDGWLTGIDMARDGNDWVDLPQAMSPVQATPSESPAPVARDLVQRGQTSTQPVATEDDSLVHVSRQVSPLQDTDARSPIRRSTFERVGSWLEGRRIFVWPWSRRSSRVEKSKHLLKDREKNGR